MWSVRLRGPRGKQTMLQIDPDASFDIFSKLAAKEVGLKAKDRPIFRRGFPPRAIEVESSALVKNVLEANDTIVVDTSSGTAAPVQALASIAANAGKRPTRVSAKKAAVKGPRNGVHTLNPLANIKKKVPSKRKLTGSGHQLGSSLESHPVDPSGLAKATDAGDNEDEPRRKYRRSRAINLTSKEDVESSLVNAVSGQSNDRAAKFFRAATKNAVDHQYELTLANARLNAALARNFEVEELPTSRRADGSAAKLRIRFKETPRKWREECVDSLKPDELQAVLKYVLLSGGETGREMLKPFNMAQVSTRVFWSIARLFDGDVAAGLAELVPDEDWSFLDTRTRIMSEKAIEAKANEEQYNQWKQSRGKGREVKSESKQRDDISKLPAAKEEKPDTNQVGLDVEQEVKQEVAAPKCAQTPALSTETAPIGALHDAVAQAALTRFERSQTSAVVCAFLQETKPADKEETESGDEIEEATTVYCDSCKKARILSPAEATNAELDKDPWTCANLVKIGRRGGCEDIDDEVAQITGPSIAEWLQKMSITTRLELADACVDSMARTLINSSDPPAQALWEKLEKLIDEARLDEVNDWMLELVGECDVVQQLEAQKLGTPADLIVTPNDLILEAVGNTCGTTKVSLDVVSSWQTRAKCLVDKHPWLADWRTL